jgi:hypothetical protein
MVIPLNKKQNNPTLDGVHLNVLLFNPSQMGIPDDVIRYQKNQVPCNRQRQSVTVITVLYLELKYVLYNLKKTLGLLNTYSTPRPDTDHGHTHRMD